MVRHNNGPKLPKTIVLVVAFQQDRNFEPNRTPAIPTDGVEKDAPSVGLALLRKICSVAHII